MLVLVVDDDPDVLDLTTSYLEELGCEMITATRASEALAKLAADKRIDILITDVQMPEMDGYELAEKAKRMRAELQVIALSGGAEAKGNLPLVRKPFLQQDLARTMEKTTGLCRGNRSRRRPVHWRDCGVSTGALLLNVTRRNCGHVPPNSLYDGEDHGIMLREQIASTPCTSARLWRCTGALLLNVTCRNCGHVPPSH
jgi:CheY-like chemotaxis protein